METNVGRVPPPTAPVKPLVGGRPSDRDSDPDLVLVMLLLLLPPPPLLSRPCKAGSSRGEAADDESTDDESNSKERVDVLGERG